MVPTGMTADLLAMRDQGPFREHHPDAQTVVRLLHGACSCDLVTERHPVGREDEARLRHRYRALGYSRDRVILALDTHRRALTHRRHPAGHWPRALAEFVAEHARNAGRSLYYLDFSQDALPGGIDAGRARTLSAAEVRANPGRWLEEGALLWVE